MKTIIKSLLAVLLTTSAKAQVIEFTPYKSEANVIVQFVRYEYQADVNVFEGSRWDSQQHAGVWSYSETDPYRIRVYVTKYAHEADIKVWLTDDRWKVKVGDDYIGLFYEERD